MNNQYFGDPRFTDEITKRIPHGYRPLRKRGRAWPGGYPPPAATRTSRWKLPSPKCPYPSSVRDATERKSEGNRQRRRGPPTRAR